MPYILTLIFMHIFQFRQNHPFAWTKQIIDAQFMLEKLSMYKSENKLISIWSNIFKSINAFKLLIPSWVQCKSNSYLTSKKSETWNRYGPEILRTLILNPYV